MILLWQVKNAAVVKDAVEISVIKTKLQYGSKTKGCIAQLWNFRVRTNQYALQKQMQDAFVKNILPFFERIFFSFVEKLTSELFLFFLKIDTFLLSNFQVHFLLCSISKFLCVCS